MSHWVEALPTRVSPIQTPNRLYLEHPNPLTGTHKTCQFWKRKKKKTNVNLFCLGLPIVRRAESDHTPRTLVSPIRRWNGFTLTRRRRLTLKRTILSTGAKSTTANYCQFWVPAEHSTHSKVSRLWKKYQPRSTSFLLFFSCFSRFSRCMLWGSGYGLIWWEALLFYIDTLRWWCL